MEKPKKGDARRKVAKQLRELIVDGELRPGDHMREVELAERLGVSRTPVREALRELAIEHLVIIRAGYGAYVSDWNSDQLEEMSDVRELLETYAAGRATRNINSDELKCLDGLCAEMEELTDSMRQGAALYDRYRTLNRKFHLVIAEASRGTHVREFISRLTGTPVHWYKSDTPSIGFLDSVNRQHRVIVAALSSGDRAVACKAMERHLSMIRTSRL